LTEIVSLIRKEHPDAALVMPGSPGDLALAVEGAGEVLDGVAPFDLPIVVCSLPTEQRASHALRVPEFLIKPVTRKDVVSAIKRLRERPQRILIVDDDRDMLQLLERIIRGEWEQVEVMATTLGAEAVTLARQRPDLILLDLVMPETSGVDVLAALRSHPSTATIPVIVISARGPAEDLAALRKGELYLLKNRSFAAGELIRVLDLVTKSLSPHYVPAPGGRRRTPEALPV